jgi:neopullulanase
MKSFVLFAAFICLSLNLLSQVNVYPSHWWVGMKESRLQLMLHGKDIGKGSVRLNPYPGVRLQSIHVPENKNYVFIDLQVSPAAKPGKLQFKLAGSQSATLQYELKAREKGNGITRNKGVTSADLVYLIMPDRFSNGDTTNDVVNGLRETLHNRKNPWSRHGGDIKGVQQKLDYLQDIGVTTVWMTPVVQNNMPMMHEWGNDVAGYHGYWITDHYNVDPRFGGNKAYKEMVATAHSKGMKVIQDAVYNHVGSHHWFILDIPMKDWLNNWPAYQGSNHKEEVFFDPYTSALDKDIMVGGWFVPHLPDLNLRNAFLANYLIQNAIWCTEEFGIDGWRVDTYKYCDEQFMNTINAALEKEFPKITIFGESWCNTPLGSAYFTQNNLDVPFKHNVQGVTDFPIAFGMKDAVLNPGGTSQLYSLLAQDALYKNPLRNCIFLENHDMDRILSVLGNSVPRLKMATGLLLTIRGIPQVYYGTEVLMKNFKNPSDAEVRRDFPGGWQQDSVNKFIPEGRTPAEQEYHTWFKKLARYRLTSPALQTGKTLHYQPADNVYVYFRYTTSHRVMCILNPNTTSAKITMNRFQQGLAGKKMGRNILLEQLVDLSQVIDVPALSFTIIEL